VSVTIKVRSGAGGPNGTRKVKLVSVSGGARPLLWLGAGKFDGLAWVGGVETLRAIRDALDEALGDRPCGRKGGG
jgi:hypothetical protein